MSTKDMNDLLDEALNQLSTESVAEILDDYPLQADDLHPLLVTAVTLEKISPITRPAPEMLATNRDEFLAQVSQLPTATVSPTPSMRLKRWITNYLPHRVGPDWSQKEPRRMTTLLAKAALIVALLFGATGGTAVLAADSMPDSTLYPIKLAMEETRLSLADNSVEEANIHLSLAETRLQEMMQMALANHAPDEETLTRLQTHYEAALQLAAYMPDEAMNTFLIQTQERIQTQTQNLTHTQARVSGPAQETLDLANGVMSQVRQQVETGLQEPQTFRWQHGNTQAGKPQENGPCNTGECEPVGDQNQFGQDENNTGHNGPGDGICDNPDGCEPVGDQHQYGQDENNTGHNGPGDGDGVCDNPDGCEPVGDQHQYGQDENNTGHNGPGDGDGICDNPDGCEPVGDQNQYGQNENNTGQNGPGDGDGICDGCESPGGENHNGQDNGQNGSGQNTDSGNDSSGGGNQNNGSQSGQGGKGN